MTKKHRQEALAKEARDKVRKPLTEEELKQCSYDADGFTISREDAMRAVERAHGIGVEDE